jgi:hypothetical protein
MGSTMNKLTKKVWKSLAAPRTMGSTKFPWVSMTSLLGPRTDVAKVKLEMGICRVENSYRVIKLTLTSLLMSTKKCMASSMVTV